MKFTHKVFHLKKHVEREHLYKSMNEYISQYSSEIDTPTVEISCKEELDNFCINYNINFKKEGYRIGSEQGWRWGELGLWVGNILAYKKFIETDFDYLILIEDDIEYIDGFFENLVRYISQLPNDWDTFFYYNSNHGNISLQNFLSIDNFDICKVDQSWSTLCYIINKKSAKKILDDVKNNFIDLPIDHYFLLQPYKYNSYTVSKNSKMYCRIANLESTFQNSQKREIL